MPASSTTSRSARWPLRLTPKLLTVLREGYGWRLLRRDAMAGFTVAVIALPFAMAVGIGSVPEGVARAENLLPPAMGLAGAVVGGFLLAALGGSRLSVGGPSGVSIAILYAIAAQHGIVGLTLATSMAGVILILMGLSRFGSVIQFIPYPVTTGFTTGSAVIIATTQIKDFFGLSIENIPPSWPAKVQSLAGNMATLHGPTLGVGAGTLALLVAMRRWLPRWPSYLIAVVAATLAVALLKIGAADGGAVATIGSRFGSLPSGLSFYNFPHITLELIRDLVPSAATIAVLVAIETLLCDVVADGLTGYRHRPDQELIALGMANLACGAMAGLPATNGMSRTIANIKAGAASPIAGILHAVIMLGVMLVGSALASQVPLAALSAVLLIVAWNMSDLDKFRATLRIPGSDVAVLLATFGLTIFFGLVYAVGIGMVLASLLFMKRMSEVAQVGSVVHSAGIGDDAVEETLGTRKDPDHLERREVPQGVEVFEINGPLFFGVAERLKDRLRSINKTPKVFILRLRRVPHIDATGLAALEDLLAKSKRNGTVLLLGGVHAQPMFTFVKTGFDQKIGMENIFETLPEALARARQIVAAQTPSPASQQP